MEKLLWSSRQRRLREHVRRYAWNRSHWGQRHIFLTPTLLAIWTVSSPSLNLCLTIYVVKITTCWPWESLGVLIMIERHCENIPGPPNSISVDSHRNEQPLVHKEFQFLLPWAMPVPGCLSRQVFYLLQSWKELKRDCWAAASNIWQSLGPLAWQKVATHLLRKVVTPCRGRDGARGLRAS